jgi:formylglycine-generating enzyme required for sulfatase activity/tRNA A-37 threonylcarbamoyl transferase component Bud32
MTVADFLNALRSLDLLPPEQTAQLAGMEKQHSRVKALGADLLRRGWLTLFQAKQIVDGKGRELVLDQYVLLDLLGQGGMGAVYKARQRRVKRDVALKLIRPDVLTSPGAVERFQREAECTAKLSHPNIITVYDANVINGVHFLVMEFIDGTDLARLVEQRGPLPVEEACHYIQQAAQGLQHTHEAGLVHRDIKPHNLMLTRHGVVKVMDLGLARTVQTAKGSATSSGLTGAETLLGTLDYQAPEQAVDARRVDIRADIYSLGCTMYHLLVGQPPFADALMAAKIAAHMFSEPPSLREARPEVPGGLGDVILRMMAKGPDDRFATPGDVAASLEPYVRSRQFTAKRSAPAKDRKAAFKETDQQAAMTRESRLRKKESTDFSKEVSRVDPAELKNRDSKPQANKELPPNSQPLRLELGNGVKLELVRIKAGSFLMGSPESDKDAIDDEKPRHKVTISKDFLLGKFAVTRGQFAQFVRDENYRSEAEIDGKGADGYFAAENKVMRGQKYSWRDTGFDQNDDHPVVNVTWNDAQAFCAWASRKTRHRVELPREAEWEYACRGGKSTRYFTGDDSDTLRGCARVADRTLKAKGIKGTENWKYFDFSDDYVFTAPVGSFKSNAWDLYDMTGNVWEWCADGKREYKDEECTNPIGPNDDRARVVRGGAWSRGPRSCRTACRLDIAPSIRTYSIGFRVVVRLDDSSAAESFPPVDPLSLYDPEIENLLDGVVEVQSRAQAPRSGMSRFMTFQEVVDRLLQASPGSYLGKTTQPGGSYYDRAWRLTNYQMYQGNPLRYGAMQQNGKMMWLYVGVHGQISCGDKPWQ